MAVRPILITGDPTLHSVAVPVTDFGPALADLVRDLTETMVAGFAPGSLLQDAAAEPTDGAVFVSEPGDGGVSGQWATHWKSVQIPSTCASPPAETVVAIPPAQKPILIQNVIQGWHKMGIRLTLRAKRVRMRPHRDIVENRHG